MSQFCVNELTAGYSGKCVVKKVSFELESGRLMGILGANGSGKTTLIKSICGILPHEGLCSLGETVLEKLSARQIARQCSYIPQRSGIAIDISVMDVVMMGFNPRLGLLEHPGSAMQDKARDALKIVGLEGLETTNYMHLSEGQKQLCILARTLVSDSRLVLMDEPESALDFRHRYLTTGLISRWVKSGERFGIVALHDPMIALNYCDQLLLLKNGESRGVMHPAYDSVEEMENRLYEIYGPVSLVRCKDKTGSMHIVMLKDREETCESGYENNLFG